MSNSKFNIFAKTSAVIDIIESNQEKASNAFFGKLEGLNLEMISSKTQPVQIWIDSKAKNAFSAARKLNSKTEAFLSDSWIDLTQISSDDFAPVGFDH